MTPKPWAVPGPIGKPGAAAFGHAYSPYNDDELARAWSGGFHAYVTGRRENPWRPGDGRHDAWDAGWLRAEELERARYSVEMVDP